MGSTRPAHGGGAECTRSSSRRSRRPLSRQAFAGGLCPSRARTRRLSRRRPNHEPGASRAPAFLMHRSESEHLEPRAHPARSRDTWGPRLVRFPGPPHPKPTHGSQHGKEGSMTTALSTPTIGAIDVRSARERVAVEALAPALLVEHVTKRFVVARRKPPVVAIDDVSLTLPRGEIHGILGANG